MDGAPAPAGGGGWTRDRFLRVMTGGAVAAGAVAATEAAVTDDDPLAASSREVVEDIVRLCLLLEEVQEAFYRQAAGLTTLDPPSLTFARKVAGQEQEHVRLLRRHASGRRPERPASAFDDHLRSTATFQRAAIDLEEAAIAVYIGQGARLPPKLLRSVGTLLSVEARQAAWIRDLAGRSPAPRAADPAADAQQVVSDLERQGFLR